ncbi:MAG: hypothetical protein II826_10840 [Prevotella sp.]|nr:hypothetical protein [Prevotella sp.]
MAYENLELSIESLRDERRERANTASRVGNILLALLNAARAGAGGAGGGSALLQRQLEVRAEEVGFLTKGDTFAPGMSVEQVLRSMLFQTLAPVLECFSSGEAVTVVKVRPGGSVTVVWAFSPNDGGQPTAARQGGHDVTLTQGVDGVWRLSQTFTEVLAPVVAGLTVSYAESDVLPEGTVTSTVAVTLDVEPALLRVVSPAPPETEEPDGQQEEDDGQQQARPASIAETYVGATVEVVWAIDRNDSGEPLSVTLDGEPVSLSELTATESGWLLTTILAANSPGQADHTLSVSMAAGTYTDAVTLSAFVRLTVRHRWFAGKAVFVTQEDDVEQDGGETEQQDAGEEQDGEAEAPQLPPTPKTLSPLLLEHSGWYDGAGYYTFRAEGWHILAFAFPRGRRAASLTDNRLHTEMLGITARAKTENITLKVGEAMLPYTLVTYRADGDNDYDTEYTISII